MPEHHNFFKTAKKLRSQEGNRFYSGSVGDNRSEQLYKVRIARSSSVSLLMTGLKTNADLELLNRQGKVLSRSTQKGQLAESITQTVGKGMYYVRVSRQQGNTHYRLSLSVDSLGSAGSAPVNPFIQEVLNLTNAHRQQAGLLPLRLNAKLTAAAQSHTEDMAINDYFSHTGLDQSSPFDRIIRAGYNYDVAAENIAAGYATPRSVVQAWMNSPGHRRNILYPELREIGVGYYFLDTDPGALNRRYYWTQDFGKPEQ